MKKILVIIALSLCTVAYAKTDKSYHSHWHENGIDDFKSSTAVFIYSKKAKFYYCISNDKENIYLNLKIIDKDIQRQVTGSGATIWINTDGKKHKKTGVKYPLGGQNRRRSNPSDPGKSQDVQKMESDKKIPENVPSSGSKPGNQEFHTDSLELIGFSESGNKKIPSGEKDNFRGSIVMQKDLSMYYEVILPLSKLPAISSKPNKKKKSGSLLFGIVYNAPITATTGAPSGTGQGMPSGGSGGGGRSGGGRPSGGGMPGGGSGGMSGGSSGFSGGGQASAPPAQIIIWIKNIDLATAK